MVEKKNEMHGEMYQIRQRTCFWCIVKDELISEVSFGILYIFKRKHVLHMFFFNLGESNARLFTNKQECSTLLHLDLSGNFRICQRKYGAVPLKI